MNTSDVCKNCGGERGIHHYETDQCPVGGREAPIGVRQEYKSTTFEIDNTDEIKKLRELIEQLIEKVDELTEEVESLQSASTLQESIQIYGKSQKI